MVHFNVTRNVTQMCHFESGILRCDANVTHFHVSGFSMRRALALTFQLSRKNLALYGEKQGLSEKDVFLKSLHFEAEAQSARLLALSIWQIRSRGCSQIIGEYTSESVPLTCKLLTKDRKTKFGLIAFTNSHLNTSLIKLTLPISLARKRHKNAMNDNHLVHCKKAPVLIPYKLHLSINQRTPINQLTKSSAFCTHTL